MHMVDSLLHPAVAGVIGAASVGGVVLAAKKIGQDELAEAKIPLMGVAGALVFAGQMINFTIPGTGSSGHIGGGILLAGLVGSFPAFLTISAVLLIQCLFFADGGLLALGCNIFNMGLLPCLVVYPLLFKPVLAKGTTAKRLTIASILAVVVGLELGAFGVVLETQLSGITQLPFAAFTALMLPIHLGIGIVEGIVTAAVLTFVYKMRPEIIESALGQSKLSSSGKLRPLFAVLAALAIVTGTAFSVFASSYPDGLEWSIANVASGFAVENDSSKAIQDATAFLPDYAFASNPDNIAGTSVSGIVGVVITFALAAIVAVAISKAKKRGQS